MENQPPVVNTPPTTEPALEAKPTVEVVPEVTTTPVQSGDKTPPNLLLKSLQEEREKVKQLEEKIQELETSALSEDAFSDEGKALQNQIKTLSSTIEEIKSNDAKRELQSSNPIFKEKWQEFEEFRQNPENKGMNMRTAAKAFLAEAGLLESPRKGLEKPTGGTRIPPQAGMSVEEIKHLRETNFKKYQEMLMKGEIKF